MPPSLFDPKQLARYTRDPGVYLMKNKEEKVIYVGKAKNLQRRLKHYFAPHHDGRILTPFLVAEIAFIDIIVALNEREALLLENTLIKQHQPKFNALLKDDKTFITLTINLKTDWPQLKLVRHRGKVERTGLYFGPYTSAHAARQTLDLMAPIFLLRQCSDQELARRKRPCLLYGIKRCVAPCVGKCTKEEYRLRVEKAVNFLKGNDTKIIQELYDEMKIASDALHFEKAASLLSMIRQIEHVLQGESIVVKNEGKNTDALALYREEERAVLVQLFFRGGKLVGSEHYSFFRIAEENEELYTSFLLQYYHDEKVRPKEILLPIKLPGKEALEEILTTPLLHPKKGDKKMIITMAEKNAKAIFNKEKDDDALMEKLLLDLQEVLKLNRFPEKIVCFDTSHTSGSDHVASMVFFLNGKYDKKRGRLFKIKNVRKGDDYAALNEAITRYLTPLDRVYDLPDLVVVDGGKGQLNSGLRALKALNIITVDLISIAKEKGKHQKSLTEEKIFIVDQQEPIFFSVQSPVLFLLQRIRDTAHRRAIEFHRKRRTVKTMQ